jgi:cytochrome c-type biogenesis protein CcmH
MQVSLVFLAAAATLALGCAAIVLRPLIRGASRAERRASYDMQVYRDQLREIDAEAARGILTPAEAEAVRVEVSRRLLAAADAEAGEEGAGSAPRRASLIGAAAFAVALAGGTLLLYRDLGAPELPDQPLQARLAALDAARAERPGQAVAETAAAEAAAGRPALPEEASEEELALVDQLAALLVERPDDVAGRRLLARSAAALGRWPQARAAQQEVVALLGEEATAADRTDLAELMVFAAGGYVSPEAEAELARALALEPENPVARYYSGLALLQSGRADLALPIWSRLLAEGPADAPWIGPIAAEIDAVAALAGQPAPPVPSREEIAGMAPEDQAAMIEGMVSQLSERLATEGGPPEDWARLIRSLGVLGRTEEAQAIWTEAQGVFAADPAALGMIEATAREAGLGQ